MENDLKFTPGGPRPREAVHMRESLKDLATPPGGPRHRSRVRRVASGQTARFSQPLGSVLRQLDAPGPPDQANWITYASWTNTTGNPITEFLSTWKVPSDPTIKKSQLLYLFNGLEPGDGKIIIQPVLQWGDSGPDEDGQNRTGMFWSVASWVVGGPDDSATHTPHIRVAPGDLLVGAIKLVNHSEAGFVYICEFRGLAGTTLITPAVSELVWCVETLEAYELQGTHLPPYDLDSASEYPANSVPFQSIGIVTSNPDPPGPWSVTDVVTQYGENTSIVNDSTTNGQIVISF